MAVEPRARDDKVGVIGILLGVGSALLVSGRFRLEPFISTEVMALSFLLSCFIGVLFGLYPAVRAANLEPIDALRYE